MTEYDYSPAAWQAYLHKQSQIDKWRQNNANFPPVNPFQPTVRDDSDFYKSKKKGKSKKKSRGRGHYSDGEDSDGSDYGGPDRPPTPPASAPVGLGGMYPGPYPLGFQPQYQGVPPNSTPIARYPQAGPPQPPMQLINNQTGQPLVPVWMGNCWVYQHPVTASSSKVRGSGSSHRSGRSSKHRRQRSVPAPLPLTVMPVPGAVVSPVYSLGSGGYFQAHPQQLATGVRGPYSASMPNMTTSAMYLPSGHTSPASGAYSALPAGYTMQMPVPQIQPQSANVKSSSASMAYSYGTVIVDGKRDKHEDKGSSFFGRLTKGKR